MIRAFVEPFIFFTIPFAVYAAWLALRLVNPFGVERWARPVLVPLVLAGLCCALAGLVVLGLTAPRYEGGYVPAHVEDGRIVPGHMR